MLWLVLGLVIFLGTHSTRIFAPAWRDDYVASGGRMTYRAIYSLLSLIGIVLIVWGYGKAWDDPVLLWDPPLWTRHIAALLMLFAFISPMPGRPRRRPSRSFPSRASSQTVSARPPYSSATTRHSSAVRRAMLAGNRWMAGRCLNTASSAAGSVSAMTRASREPRRRFSSSGPVKACWTVICWS